MMPARLPRRNQVIAAGAVTSLFLAAALPLILTRHSVGRAAADQKLWHLPTILQFVREWPHPNLREYSSATTPGYHLCIAFGARMLGTTDERILRCLGMAFTIALLATLAVVAARRGTEAAIVLCLPAVASLYIFGSGVWLLPENAGWLGVLLAMMLALRRRVDAWTYVGIAILLLLLVFVRQIDLWVAAPLLGAAWLGSDGSSAVGNNLASRYKRVALALLAVIPSLVMLYTFFRLWNGLVPPTIRTSLVPNIAGGGEHHGGNPAVLPLVLSTFAVFSPFYLAWLETPEVESPEASNPRLRPRISVSIGLIVGAVAGVLPRTSYDEAAGRWSGLWRLAGNSPIMGNHSPVIALLSTIGGGMLGYMLSTLPRRDRCIFLASWIAFCAAQFANHQAWQRYIDPFVLITLILVASRARQRRESEALGTLLRAVRGLPVVLALVLAAITIAALR